MKRILAALLACLPVAAAFSQSGTVHVTDALTLRPVQNARCAMIRNGQETGVSFTDAGGWISVPAGSGDSLIVQANGYETVRLSLGNLVTAEVQLHERSYTLDAVVLSASRFEEKKQDLAHQVQTLTAKDIAFANPANSGDLLQQSGQVFVQKSQMGGGSPVLRGFEASRVLLVVDGVRMNNAIYRSGHLQNIITLDPNMLERTEIVFGPGSVLYGSDALGGVMHFYSRRPSLAGSGQKSRINGNAMMRYGTAAQEKTAHFDLNIGLQRWGFLTSVTAGSFDDLRQGNIRNDAFGKWGKCEYYAGRVQDRDTMLKNADENMQVGTGYSQVDVMQKVMFRANPYQTHLLNLQYSTSTDVPRYDRLQQYSGGKLRFAEWYYGPQERLLASYRLELSRPRLLWDLARVTVAYQQIEESRHDRRFGKDTRNHRTENVHVYSALAEFSKSVQEHEIRYGLDASFNQVSSTAFSENILTGETGSIDTRYPDGGSQYRTLAAFLSHSWEISPKLILHDGIRANQVYLHSAFIDTTFFPFPYRELTQNNFSVNGNLGMVYLPGTGWKISMLGSTGFRAPNVDDIGKVFESTPGQLVVPNPNLKPENVYNAEAGVQKIWGGNIQAEVTGWYSLFRQAIITAPGTLNGQDTVQYDGQPSAVYTLANADAARIFGTSASLNADITPQFSLNSTLTWTRGQILTDSAPTPLDHIPPMYGRTGIVFKMSRLRTECFVLYNGWKRLKDYNMTGEDNFVNATPWGTPAWYTLNVRLHYTLSKNVSLQAALENVMDQNYRTFSSGVSAPGRNLLIALRAGF